VSAFVPAVRAEFTKTLSTRMWWVLLIILFAYVGLLAAGISFGLGALDGSGEANAGPAPAGTGDTIAGLPVGLLAPIVYSLATSVGYVFPTLLGALVVTNEFRHKTLTPTFLATPGRGSVLSAKWVVLLVFGALFGVVALLGTVGLGAAGLATFGFDAQLGESDMWALFARAVLAMALWGLVGVGLGVMVPSQVGSIVIILAFTQFVEPILRLAASFADWAAQVGRFLPGAASDALVGSSIYTAMSGTAMPQLDWWQGGLVLLGYAALFTLIGYFANWRRDVT
jgi:ABC-type transport system involved in multi-copper enzyme maturation permease subunit